MPTAIVTASRYLSPVPLLGIAWRCKKTVAIATLILGAAVPYYLHHYICAPRTEEDEAGVKVTDCYYRVFSPQVSKDESEKKHNIEKLNDLHYIEKRSDLRIIVDRYIDITRDFFARMLSVWERFRDCICLPSGVYVKPEDLQFSADTNHLYVFVHGLRGHPCRWNAYRKEIHDQDGENAEFAQIYVPHSGNCSLEDATSELYQKIKGFIGSNEDKKVALIGTSRGGPIALYLAHKLKLDHVQTKVFVATIAGANHGSKFMDLFNSAPLLWRRHDKSLRSELSYSPIPRYSLTNDGTREYHAYTTTEDVTIVPFTSSFLCSKEKNVHNYVGHGEGHVSVVDRVRGHLIKKCIAFMTKDSD